MKKSLLLSKILTENTFSTQEVIDEAPLKGRVGNYDYQNPRVQKDVEDFERKGYEKIDKRSPSFRYKDGEGEYTPMMKKIQEENNYYSKMATHHSGVLSDFILPKSITVKDLEDTYRLYFELKVPLSFGYDAQEIKDELQGTDYRGPGQSYSRTICTVRRVGDSFLVKVWVSGGMDI